MPLWMIATLAGVCIGCALLCVAACALSSRVTLDEYDLEHERQIHG